MVDACLKVATQKNVSAHAKPFQHGGGAWSGGRETRDHHQSAANTSTSKSESKHRSHKSASRRRTESSWMSLCRPCPETVHLFSRASDPGADR